MGDPYGPNTWTWVAYLTHHQETQEGKPPSLHSLPILLLSVNAWAPQGPQRVLYLTSENSDDDAPADRPLAALAALKKATEDIHTQTIASQPL